MTADRLIEHVINHHANTCTLCGKQANSHYGLQKHLACCHREEYDAIASQNKDIVKNCQTGLNVEKVQIDLSEATVAKEVVGERLFQCKDCDAKFTTTNKLIDHAYNYHTDGAHICTFCGRQTDSQTQLRNHFRKVHKGTLGIGGMSQENDDTTKKHQTEPNDIESVQMDFSEPKSEDIDENEGLEMKTFQCQKCFQSFISVFCLNQHLEKAHDTNTGTVLIRPAVNVYKCECCSKDFDKNHHLQMHMRIHHGLMKTNHAFMKNTVVVSPGVKLHKCEYCSIAFDTRPALEAHGPSCKFSIQKKEASKCAAVDLTHQQHVEKTQNANVKTVIIYKCEYCSKVFRDKHSLQLHLRTHTFQCPSCEFSFRDQQRLNKHLMTHAVNKLLKCEICQWVFKTKENYKAHMLIHGTGSPNHTCTICHKLFSKETILNEHMKVHQWEESKQNYPKERSLQESNHCLKNHALIHKMEIPHQCVKCGRGFETKEELQKHTEDHCQDKPPNKGEYAFL